MPVCVCRKDNVIRLWNYLLELLRARRMRLELSLQLQKIFQEMLYILDWMEEIKVTSFSCCYNFQAPIALGKMCKLNKVVFKTLKKLSLA